jgi:protocatechuate 3,4-dioxygenase beta subunit
MDSRRSFLLRSARLALASRLKAQQPFDSLPAGVWKNARRNGLIMIHRETPSELFSHAQIAAPGEPGDPLVVAGQVFAPDGRTPAAGVTVYAYNTDAEGYYGANRIEYPPRIYGWMKSGAAGRFELRTVYPGHYPNMRVPAHVHFELWGGGYPIQWAEAVQFAGDSYLTKEMLAEDDRRGQFRTVREVRGGRCEYQMRLGTASNYSAG